MLLHICFVLRHCAGRGACFRAVPRERGKTLRRAQRDNGGRRNPFAERRATLGGRRNPFAERRATLARDGAPSRADACSRARPFTAIALTCEAGGSPSEPRSHDRGHAVVIRAACQPLPEDARARLAAQLRAAVAFWRRKRPIMRAGKKNFFWDRPISGKKNQTVSIQLVVAFVASRIKNPDFLVDEMAETER